MKNKISHIVLAVTLLIILSLTLTAFGPSAVAYAADGSNAVNFDKTDVLDDLKGSALNGVPFDVEDYPYDKNGEISVLGFVEYCYSEYENLRGNYGLYLYLYNPALKDISESSNRIQMAVKYAADGTPTEYNKFDLQYCNKSVGVEANRFWKFKVVGAEHFLDIVEMTARTYYVSGVEIWSYGDKTPVEIGIKTSYTWTGFAEGYGSSGEPLNCTVEQFEGIDLKVKHTSYITGMSAAGANHYNQVHTAYFAVPNYYFDNYGRLQKIFAEWYEYKLKNMLVTQDKDFFDCASSYTGYMLSDDSDVNVKYSVTYGQKSQSYPGVGSVTEYEWAYNEKSCRIPSDGIDGAIEIKVYENQYIMPLVFYSEVSDPYEIFKFLNKYFKNAGDVDSSVLLDKIYAYSNDLGHGYVDPTEKKVSKDLFYDYVDEGRVRGFQQREVDFNDTFDLNSYESNHDWWDELKDFGLFWKPDNLGESYKNVRPIYEVKDDDLLGGDAEIAKRLLLNEKDVPEFKEYYEANKRDNHIVLFRFAVTDYTAHRAGYTYLGSDGYNHLVLENKSNSYVCSESVFLNFDIISLTFNDDGEYRAFAVVSDPIDIVGDLEPPAPPEWADDLEEAGQNIADFFKKIGDWFKDNWKRVLVGIGVILALIAIAIFIVIIYKARGNKVTVEVRPESSTKRASRSYTKRVPGNNAGRKDGRKGG